MKCNAFKNLGFAVTLFLLPGSLSLADETGETLTLSLGEAMMRVEEDNFSLLINREGIEQALAGVGRERSFLLPQVDLEARQARSRFVTRGGGGTLGGDPLAAPSSGGVEQDTFDAGLQANWTLLDPVLLARLRASEVAVDVAGQEFEELRQTVLTRVAEAYLDFLLEQRRLQVFRANVERSEAYLELARSRVEAEVAAQIDLTRAEVQLAQDQQGLIEQENTVFVREAALKRLLAIPQEISLEVEPFRTHLQMPPEMGEEWAEEGLSERAEYRTAERRRDQNELEVRAARWERFPSFNLFGDYRWVTETAFDGNEENEWTIGVGASLPIFEGFRIRSNVLLANSRLRASETALRDVRAEIEQEYQVILRDLKARLAQIEVAEKTFQLSQEELELAEVRFEEGVADNRDLVDAQNSLAQAEDNREVAYSRYDRSRLEWARIRGDVYLLLADQAMVLEEEGEDGR